MKSISVNQLKEWQDNDIDFQLVDVRENNEYVQGSIRGADHIPMSQLTSKMEMFEKGKPIVLFCLSGMRSFQVGNYIARQFSDQEIYNLEGGINAWAASN